MTHQILKSTDHKELFNLAYLGVLGQGKPSVITKPYPGSKTCVYKDHEGNRCGVGHTLTPEALKKAAGFIDDALNMLDEFDYDDRFEHFERDNDIDKFLVLLQKQHDRAADEVGPGSDALFIEQFKQNMKQFAAKKFPKRTFDYKHGIL